MRDKLRNIERRIGKIKRDLAGIGEMRPGSLSRQGRSGRSRKVYYQLSYTRSMRGRTEYIRPAMAPEIKQQIAEYRRFRRLIDEWVELAIEHSRLKIELSRGE